MSDDIEPADRYRQRAARLRALVADCDSPAIVQRLLGMASEYEHLAKLCEAAKLWPLKTNADAAERALRALSLRR